MKNLRLGISVLALAVASTAFAQTTSNKWMIGVGAHGVNHTAQRNNFSNTWSVRNFDKHLFNINQYSITPPLSKLTVARNIGKGLVLDWQTTVGNIANKRFVETAGQKEFFLQTGLGLQFKAAGLLWDEESWFDPYLRVGANYLRHQYSNVTFPVTDENLVGGGSYAGFSENQAYTQRRDDHFTVSTGAGINFWLTKNFGLGVQGDYVTTPTDKSNIANFWQASASLNFRFGQTDRDKDGILDKDDACPDTPGLPEFQGCPDTDGDGVPDKDDQCPEVAGPVENNGCPWPDTDGDGVYDKDDACPSVAGPAENNGCPWPDTDGDGIFDKDDACPTVPGLAQYNGCPKPQSAYAEEATGALRDILFNFDKATIRPESAAKLDQAAEIIKSSNGGTFLITGHTDAKGNANYNLNLSKRRAATVVTELEKRGVSDTQLKSVGVGARDAQVPATASNEERLRDRKVVVEAVNGAAWEALQKSDLPVVKKKVVKKSTSKKRK